MALKTKIVLYVLALHAVLAAAAVFVLIERPLLLFAVEALFVVSIAVSAYLVRGLFVPLELIRTGAEMIAERDFTSRFVPAGQPEMDTLIDVYNRMIDRLREERLAALEQHQLLSKIVEAAPAGIVICDFDGNVERMNPAAKRILGGATIPRIEPGQSLMLSQHSSQRVKVTRSGFRDRGFEKSFYVVEEMTEELRLSEKNAYEKLIRMMSHEVNNSVGAVRSLLESALRYAPQVGEHDREDFTSALAIASARIDALNRFMAAFADVVRIPLPHRTHVDVGALVSRVAALMRPELTDRRIGLELALDDAQAVDADESQLEQVVINVVRNAMESVHRDGNIRIGYRDGVLTIVDSGAGIAAPAQAELFTPFFTTKRDGRGLGLTVVQEILANHAFPFSLENAPGGGAVFTIRMSASDS